MEICAQTHKNLGANGTKKVLYSLFVRWYFSKPLRLLQWGGILMKLAVCSDRSGDIDSDEIISIRDDAAMGLNAVMHTTTAGVIFQRNSQAK